MFKDARRRSGGRVETVSARLQELQQKLVMAEQAVNEN